jgi:ERCC4-type nuclease
MKEKNPIKIKADSREHISEIPRILERMGVKVETVDLYAGDYILGPDICCERKSASDFAMSIFDRRLFSQVVLLKAEFSRPLFIIEGDVYSIQSNIDRAAICGALSYLHAI